MGGSLGRREATGRGVMIIARESARASRLRSQGRAHRRAGLRQCGLGGRGPARRTWARRSSRSPTGKSASTTPNGLDIKKLLAHNAGAPDRRRLRRRASRSPTPELFKLDVDVLIPAAIEEQITAANVQRHQGQADRRGRQRSDDARGAQASARARRVHRPGHPRQRRRRHRVVLRVGAGPPRLFLGGARGERPPRGEDGARRSTPCSRPRRSTTSTCASPPTSWRSTAWRR